MTSNNLLEISNKDGTISIVTKTNYFWDIEKAQKIADNMNKKGKKKYKVFQRIVTGEYVILEPEIYKNEKKHPLLKSILRKCK